MTSPAYVFDSWGPNKNEKTYVVTCDEHPRPITTKHNRAEAQKVADAHNKCFHFPIIVPVAWRDELLIEPVRP